MKAKMRNNLIERYEKSLPGELAAAEETDRDARINFLNSIEGKKVTLVFTLGDAFEENDNNLWLPKALWDKL